MDFNKIVSHINRCKIEVLATIFGKPIDLIDEALLDVYLPVHHYVSVLVEPNMD